MTGRVRVLRVDRRIETLDRLERALLEEPVRLGETRRAVAQLGGPQPERARGPADEQREREPQRREDAADGQPDREHALADQLLEVGWVRVDLVRPDRMRPRRVVERRVHLNQVLEAELAL